MTRLKVLAARVKAAVKPTSPTWVQDILALSTVATVIILAALQMPIPEILSGIAWVVIGYFFGTLKGPAPTPPDPATLQEKGPVQRTRQGQTRGKLVHFQCVQPDPETPTP